MKVEILYFQGCPNYVPALERLRSVLRQEGVPAVVSEIEVKDQSNARALNFLGSPTIRVNGLDIEPDSPRVGVAGLACRRYAGGLPSEDMIRAALRNAREG